MSRRIQYHIETPYAGEKPCGVIEVDDDTAEEQIEEMVRDEFFNQFNYGWCELAEGEEGDES
ncbi:hypothetical protein [Stenotrophomonas sp. AB1(2024)]|uniref:hypothetical protein n=1 Tax=Stenotrophomonas sp. AB1(2024) TaxID=3132215 RepID=UPI0030AC5A75